MKKSTYAEAQGWVELADEMLDGHLIRLKNNGPKQAKYTSLSSWSARKARAQYLRGDPVEQVRATYRQAAEYMEISFIMAYDTTSPRYIGNTDKLDCSSIDEVCCLEMMNFALLANDLDYAIRVARWVQPRPSGSSLGIEVCNYVYGLKHTLLSNWEEAEKLTSDTFARHPDGLPKKQDYKTNYYTLSWGLAGILRRDDGLLNEGVAQQLAFYRGIAEGEMADTDEQYLCDNAIALAILGQKTGRTITVSGDYFARELIP